MARLRQYCLLVTLMIMLAGCDPFSSPDSMMDEYVHRLARVLDVEVKTTTVEAVMPFPRLRDRRVEIPEIDISMLAFFGLYGCELQVVVAERNSIMGRVMSHLNRLRYDLRFIETAQTCVAKTAKPQIKTSLKQAIQQKQQLLPMSIWNAIWSSDAMAKLLSLSKGAYAPGNHNDPVFAELVAGLKQTHDKVKKLMNTQQQVDLDSMGAIQQQWAFGHQAGQLLNSAHLLTTRLNDATTLINKRLQHKPLCYLGKSNKQAERVKGLFFHVYIARIQPYVSDVNKAGNELFGTLDKIVRLQQDVMPESFQSYYQQMLNTENEHGFWHRFDLAIQKHTKSWQTLLNQCGMQPMAG